MTSFEIDTPEVRLRLRAAMNEVIASFNRVEYHFVIRTSRSDDVPLK